MRPKINKLLIGQNDAVAELPLEGNLATLSPKETEQLEVINHFIDIDCIFWDRDSHGLFDYESKSLKRKHLTTIGCMKIARDGYDIQTVIPGLSSPTNYQELLSIVYKANSYWIYHTKSLYKQNGELDSDYNHFDQAWQVIRMQNMKTRKINSAYEM